MSLKRSAERGASSFTVSLDRLVDLRNDLDSRARAAEVAGQASVNVAHGHAIRELSKMISAARAAGRADRDRNVVLDRASARQLHRMATDLDDNADALLHRAETADSMITRQKNEEAAKTVEAEAARLWYALTVFMEHTGLGAEEILDFLFTERRPPRRQR